MSNYWMIPRAKRTLVSLPLVLSVVSATALGKEWSSRDVTLALEGMLEKYQIKRTGKRRDQSGGGGRTYRAWLEALGFIFKEDESGLFRLTKAGEKLQKGEETIRTVTNQLMKMQYPSVYSIKPMVDVSRRFSVHPFRFLLSLLASHDIKYLTEEEIALFAVTEGESDDDKCLEKVKNEILHFRADKNSLVLDATFAAKHGSRNGARSIVKTISSLKDIANTFINYLEYTQLAGRDEEGRLGILKTKEVQDILERPAFFNRHDPNASPESFQRAFGLGPEDIRDDRKFEGENVNADNISRQLVNTAFLYRANFHLVDVNNQAIVESIAKETGVPKKDVANYLKVFSGKERDILSAAYVGMAFAGQDEATNFKLQRQNFLDKPA